ncbi:sensor histidine kinase [Streptomyces sp. NPDC021093]|uniref:sensor histidine kinase n=1 Tax=Streptomyces sp. NPDC021093 TaxID=3365112 RepID=UPI00379A7600
MPSLTSLLSAERSAFTAAGEYGGCAGSSEYGGAGGSRRRLRRAGVEAVCAGVLVILAFPAVNGLGDSLPVALRVLLALLAIGLFVVRRRCPVASVLGLAAVVGAVPAVGLLTAVASYAASRQVAAARRRTVLLVGGSALATVGCAAFAPYSGIDRCPFGLALGAVLATTTVLGPGLVGAAAGQRDRLLRALRERTAAAEEAERQADSASRIHERSRIAAEMHDLVGHRLSLISLHAGGLELALQKQAPGLRGEAALVRGATQDAMRELREVLDVLGPLGRDTGTAALTDATGTRADVESLVAESRVGGVRVDLAWEGPDLDGREARVRRAVHRVVREALTNVHRYAAGARVHVRVTHDERRVTIAVRNGVPPSGARPPTRIGTGRGLTGLRERVGLLGGTLDAGPTPSGGFAVSAELPAEPDTAARTGPAGPSPYADVPEVPSGQALSGVRRRLVATAAGLLGLAGVSVLTLFGMSLVDEAMPGPDQEHREPPRIGMSRQEVRSATAMDSDEARAAAVGHEPTRPRSATSCVYPSSTTGQEHRARGELELVRYCFTGDTLTAVDRFKVPLITEPTGPQEQQP